jgi:hypothetical protein
MGRIAQPIDNVQQVQISKQQGRYNEAINAAKLPSMRWMERLSAADRKVVQAALDHLQAVVAVNDLDVEMLKSLAEASRVMRLSRARVKRDHLDQDSWRQFNQAVALMKSINMSLGITPNNLKRKTSSARIGAAAAKEAKPSPLADMLKVRAG